MTSIWEGIHPRLTGCDSLARAVPHLPPRTLLHAGPPYAAPDAVPVPVRNAACAALLSEGWADTIDEAAEMLRSGAVHLAPAQDFDVVTPLACVVPPSMPVLRVEACGLMRLTPVNDGPADGALRFGDSQTQAQIARIKALRGWLPQIADLVGDGVDLLPLMNTAIHAGDDLHGSVAQLTDALADALTVPAATPADLLAYIRTPLFGLNPVMAAASVLSAALAMRQGAPVVVAAGGNGVDFGWKSSATPDIWETRPAHAPVGPRMKPDAPVLPAIGDSAVIDALGLGAAILRHAPALRDALAPFHPPQAFTPQASACFLAPHPTLPGDIRLGLPMTALSDHPGIMLAMLGAGGEGLIGRGIAPWPAL